MDKTPHGILTKLLNHLFSDLIYALHEESKLKWEWILGVMNVKRSKKRVDTVEDVINNYRSDFLRRLRKDLTDEEIVREIRDVIIFSANFVRIFRKKEEQIESLITHFLRKVEEEGIHFNRQELESIAKEVMRLEGKPLLEQLLERRNRHDPYDFGIIRGSAKQKRETDLEHENQQGRNILSKQKEIFNGILIFLIFAVFVVIGFFVIDYTMKYTEEHSDKVEEIKENSYEVFGNIYDKIKLWYHNTFDKEAEQLLNTLQCWDGTPYGRCSEKRPAFCQDGYLSSKASLCGCPDDKKIDGELCRQKGTESGDIAKDASFGCSIILIEYNYKSTKDDGRKAIEYINELRENYDREPIEFDERVFELAVARARDMREYNYLDHTNPYTGTCPHNIKSKYGLGPYEYVAENAFGNPEYSEDSCTQIEIRDMKEAIDSWMTSEGHKHNLLFYQHKKGAVGCYKNMCTFLGLNHEHFGEGCYTAAEGMAYWENVKTKNNEENLANLLEEDYENWH